MQLRPAPHVVPFVFRDPQAWLSLGADSCVHAPLLQTFFVQLRDWVPPLLQVGSGYTQLSQAAQVTPLPQGLPSVVRGQSWVSIIGGWATQLPFTHAYGVHIRVCVPVVAHSLAPLHALRAPQLGAGQPPSQPAPPSEGVPLSGAPSRSCEPP